MSFPWYVYRATYRTIISGQNVLVVDKYIVKGVFKKHLFLEGGIKMKPSKVSMKLEDAIKKGKKRFERYDFKGYIILYQPKMIFGTPVYFP